MTDTYALDELNHEARMGALGAGSESLSRSIPSIDLSDFHNRRAEISAQLWQAATEVGFFQVFNHGIALAEIKAAFAGMEHFFALPEATKSNWPLKKGMNAGWESKAQIRPSTRTPDQKESYQITRPHMHGLWPDEGTLAGFRESMLAFEQRCWSVAMDILSCFAERLGFAQDFFSRAHTPEQPGYQSTLRLLHYFPNDPQVAADGKLWRAGAHTDFDCLTLLFQQAGQGGLQVCPGKEYESWEWTNVEPLEGVITCNIGDMLMRWSDDQLKSNFHRVRNPRADEHQGSRYSLAFFAQANRDVMIQGPQGKYAQISAEDYLYGRVNANFAALAATPD